ncbi:MAG: DUF3108 domain-containing protein, partial [Lysobacterales bacterium]
MSKVVNLSVILLLLVSELQPALAGGPATLAPSEYTAIYEVLRNDEKVANVTLELSRQGDEWTFHGFTHDMHGLGKVLNVKGKQGVTGKWRDGSFQPEDFTFSFSLVGFRSRWQANFDWIGGSVTTGKKSKKITLPLADGAMDPMSLLLNTGAMLSTGRSEIALEVIDKDEVEKQLYRAHPGEFLDTALGCMKATRVERIRENAKRRSTAWYAEELAYIPLQARHTKKKG